MAPNRKHPVRRWQTLDVSSWVGRHANQGLRTPRIQPAFEGSDALLGAGEKFAREAAVFEHLRVDRTRLVEIQAHAGKILQPHAHVVIDIGAGKPGFHVRRATGVGAEKVSRAVKVHGTHGLRDACVIGTIQPVFEPVDVEIQRLRLAE